MKKIRAWWDGLVEEPGLLGRVRRQWPWVSMMVVMAVGLALIGFWYWRRGAAIIGVAFVMGGIFRAALKNPGILIIRRKWIDLLLYFGIGVSILVMAAIVAPPPPA
ncbi:MAG: DUF3017 domain-containing protein [Propionibacteriaceae bacterium]|jgi:hypothetical protein|nr:DUF3017 domain-containing protein [Propionibacteriaceae bacterium]